MRFRHQTVQASALFLAVALMGTPATSGDSAQATQAQTPETQKLLLNGFRRYHSVCNHCHGPDGLGSSFGPSLVDEIPDEDAFRQVVLEGVSSPNGGMKGFAENADVVAHLDAIYAYIRARAAGDLGRGRPR